MLPQIDFGRKCWGGVIDIREPVIEIAKGI